MEIDKLKACNAAQSAGHQRQEKLRRTQLALRHRRHEPGALRRDDVDIQRVIQNGAHDIVKSTPATLVYDLAARAAIHIRKVAARAACSACCRRLQREYFTALWQEYEDGESADARFALLLDRTMPMLMNLHNEGQAAENGISLEQVLARNASIADVHPEAVAPHGATPAGCAAQGWLVSEPGCRGSPSTSRTPVGVPTPPQAGIDPAARRAPRRPP